MGPKVPSWRGGAIPRGVNKSLLIFARGELKLVTFLSAAQELTYGLKSCITLIDSSKDELITNLYRPCPPGLFKYHNLMKQVIIITNVSAITTKVRQRFLLLFLYVRIIIFQFLWYAELLKISIFLWTRKNSNTL